MDSPILCCIIPFCTAVLFLRLNIGLFLLVNVIKSLIVRSLQRQPLHAQGVVDRLIDQIIDNGKAGNCDNHSHKSEQASEDQNGEQHPEACEAGRVSENFRSQNIAVKLLQNQDPYQQNETLDRAYQKH